MAMSSADQARLGPGPPAAGYGDGDAARLGPGPPAATYSGLTAGPPAASYSSAGGGVALAAGEQVRKDLHLRPEEVDSIPSTELDSDSDSDTSTDEEEDELTNFGPDDTIMIFDWDDTILPSYWLQQQDLNLNEESIPTEEQKQQLERMAKQAAVTLNIAKRYGKVVLVTNAERGWIELSCQKFMPSVYPSLEHVKLMSARSTFEPRGVRDPFDWKFHAFQYEIDEFFAGFDPNKLKNVISLGDSAHEREALIRVTENMGPNCCTKSVKFAERPELEALLKEHQLLAGCFRHIVNHPSLLDLCIKTG